MAQKVQAKPVLARKTGLATLDAATAQLAKASTLVEVKDIHDKAEAIRKYAAASGAGMDIQNAGAELRLRAERKAGPIIRTMFPYGGDRKSKKSRLSRSNLISDFGISPYQSTHWQKEASVPEDRFEKHITEMKDAEKELTSASVLNILKVMEKEDREERRAQMAKKGRSLPDDKRCSVRVGDMKTYKIKRQFDFVITDPPYKKEYLDLYGVLAKRANEWLKSGGVTIVMCGQSYLDEIYRRMSEHLEYYWTGCYSTPGQPNPLRARQVNTMWKPLLFFVKQGDTYKGKIFGDVFTSDAKDKSLHEWGQSESGMLSIISGVCLPGQSIFDPFLGAGTTGVAAKRHGCLFHGIDVDPKCVALSKGRFANDSAKKS